MFPLTTDPRIIVESDFPAEAAPAEQWRFLINYALLALSEYNTQPWLFRVQGDSVEIFADPSRRLPVVDPEDRELLISCGAACLNLRLALRHFGVHEAMECAPFELEEPDQWLSHPLACLRFGVKQRPTPQDERLFSAIPRRHSNRSIYERRDVPKMIPNKLQQIAGREGTWLQIVQDASLRRPISDLIVAGDRRQWADKRFRNELAEWVHPRKSGNVDGLPGSVRAKGSFYDMTSPFLVRTFDL